MKIINNLKVLILAGGFGSRLSDLTHSLPKPLVRIGRHPIIFHIMRIYLSQGVNDFYIAAGYKKNQFLKFFKFNKNKFLNKKNPIQKKIIKIDGKDCRINIIDTGANSMTGGRVKEAFKYIKDNLFFLTYGDGLANVNISKLLKFHIKNKKLITVTAVNPPPRFGEITIKNSTVSNFSEKKNIKNVWINGGFFVVDKKFIRFIKNKNTILEQSPLEKVARINKMSAYKHYGFWQCMDTKRDRDKLIELINKKKYCWLNV
jgi:glucose-1-phosphate cytidylyltransferase